VRLAEGALVRTHPAEEARVPAGAAPIGTELMSMPWWMTAAIGTSALAVEAWWWEMVTTGTPRMARKIADCSSSNGPWLVVTTGGVLRPRL
jgi:hypothetical protein